MSQYSAKDKLEMIEEYEKKRWSQKKISKEHGISESGLREILGKYQKEGATSVKESRAGEKRKKYSGAFKLTVVQERLDSNIGYREQARKYGLNHVVIMQWERIYLTEGESGLLEEHRGKQTKEGCPRIGRPKKLNKKVEQDLLAEVQQLRMENEYLKKLSALVQSERKLQRGKKR